MIEVEEIMDDEDKAESASDIAENVQRNALAWMPIESDNFKESLKEIVKEVEEYYGREMKLYVTNTARQSACTQIYL